MWPHVVPTQSTQGFRNLWGPVNHEWVQSQWTTRAEPDKALPKFKNQSFTGMISRVLQVISCTTLFYDTGGLYLTNGPNSYKSAGPSLRRIFHMYQVQNNVSFCLIMCCMSKIMCSTCALHVYLSIPNRSCLPYETDTSGRRCNKLSGRLQNFTSMNVPVFLKVVT